MNDDVQPPDTPSDELLAVSAVVDGSATPDQRAVVDASPALTEQLDQFQADRDQIRSVQVPTTARESAVAAALAAFDQLHPDTVVAAPVPAHPSNVVSLDTRRRWYRLVAGAAAALLLVAGGAAALGAFGDSSHNDSSATAATAAQKQSDDAGAAADQSTMAADAPTAAGAATENASTATAPSAAQTDATTAPAGTDAPAATIASAAPNSPVSTIGVIPGPGEVTPNIDDPAGLASYAANASSVGRSSAEQCVPAGDDDLGRVTYQGTPAVIARHPDDGVVSAYAVDGCSILATIGT
jgi:hypothetical protein